MNVLINIENSAVLGPDSPWALTCRALMCPLPALVDPKSNLCFRVLRSMALVLPTSKLKRKHHIYIYIHVYIYIYMYIYMHVCPLPPVTRQG